MIWEDLIALVVAGLACGFFDSSLGMGYGVTSASVLVSFGVTPAIASASVHTARRQQQQAFVDTVSAASHLKFNNVRKDLLVPLIICGTIVAILGAAGLAFLGFWVAVLNIRILMVSL